MKVLKTKSQLIEEIAEHCSNHPSSYTLDLVMHIFHCDCLEYPFMSDILLLADDEKVKNYVRGLMNSRFSSLEDVHYFIKEVMNESIDIYEDKPRSFYIGQRVYDCIKNMYGTITAINDKEVDVKEINEKVDNITILYDTKNKANVRGDVVKARYIYSVPSYDDLKGRMTCPKCGGILLDEHSEEINYEYYCPNCDENIG